MAERSLLAPLAGVRPVFGPPFPGVLSLHSSTPR